jgi:hypothetical protein
MRQDTAFVERLEPSLARGSPRSIDKHFLSPVKRLDALASRSFQVAKRSWQAIGANRSFDVIDGMFNLVNQIEHRRIISIKPGQFGFVNLHRVEKS